jgi:Rhamnan synthesis protein F
MPNPLGFFKRILRRLSVKAFATSIYLSAWLEYWISPKGRRGGVMSRLRELPTTAANHSLPSPAKIALFIAYSPVLTLSNQAYVKTLSKAGFAVIYICNCKLLPEAAAAIGALAWRLFERHNLGRDVGGFRDGVLLLEREGLLGTCDTLLIANDSMQFLPGANADSLVQALQRFEAHQSDGLFSHISQAFGTHYQSYFQVLGRSILRSPEFIRFWRDYRPLSHRGHCIFNGEIALSTSVYRRFGRVDVLYTSETLQQAIRRAHADSAGVPASEIMRLVPSPARTVQRRKTGYSLEQLLRRADKGETLAFWELDWLADLIEANNPSHVAAFLYPIYLGCPLVKQDLCMAGSFTIAQAISLFREALERSAQASDEAIDIGAHVQEYADMLYRRGTPMSYIDRPWESALKGVTGGFVYAATYDGNL